MNTFLEEPSADEVELAPLTSRARRDDDDDENSPSIKTIRQRRKELEQRFSFSLRYLVLAGVLGCACFFVITRLTLNDTSSTLMAAGASDHHDKNDHSTNVPKYVCPAVSGFESDYNENESSNYVPKDEKILSDFDKFVATFRRQSFDAWGRSFEQFKQNMYKFKSKHFVDNLKSGDTIYESACGTGLNLLLTLEIIQEASNGTITNLTFYGNEYVPQSVKIANRLAKREGVFPPNAQLGQICQGDSLNLSNVPSNAFDLVYTGYITPLQNPLHFKYDNETHLEVQLLKTCVFQNWTDQKSVMQQRQDDWFGLWVKEMVRIAKPGAAILIEQVAQPYCEILDDWGGVNQTFWWRGVRDYGWDVEDVGFEADDRPKSKRYHVFMRKKKNKK